MDAPLLRSVYGKRLRDDRRAVVGWAVGIAILLSLYLVSFPPIKENAEDINRVVEAYPPEVRALIGDTDIGDPAGYLNAEYFQFTGPILLLIFGIRRGVAAVAGEEARGTMELLLSTPVSRPRAVLEPWASAVSLLAGLTLVQVLVIAVAGPAFQLDVGVWNLAAASLSLLLMVVLFTTLALTVGAATGRPGLAAAVPTVAAVLAFVVHSFADLVDWMGAVSPLSPWTWYLGNDPLREGLMGWHVASLIAGTALLLVVAVWGFERRDVGA